MKSRNHYTGCLSIALSCAGLVSAQTFSSGSTGSDGALSYTAAGTYDFDPAALGLNPAGDNIFNFTTINIASGVTLKLRSSKLRGEPVIWLATGNVTIAGIVDLSGATGANLGTAGADWITLRAPTEPGPGGFPGGVGARPGVAAYPGLGPGGSPTQTNAACAIGGSGSFATAGQSTPAGPTYGNIQTVPLIGGSGGSGGCVAPANTAADAAGGTGGAGGGAIRIVSSTQISIPSSGEILCHGGVGGAGRSGGTQGGNGAGGAINLIAPAIAGSGYVEAYGGPLGGLGYVLINATTNTFKGTTLGTVTLRPLLAPPLPAPTATPTVIISSVAGVNTPAAPQGQFQTPDVTFSATTPVTISISAAGIPVGTVVKLNIQSELAPDQIISCNPLSGTAISSTTTCSASFPSSVSRILASASW